MRPKSHPTGIWFSTVQVDATMKIDWNDQTIGFSVLASRFLTLVALWLSFTPVLAATLSESKTSPDITRDEASLAGTWRFQLDERNEGKERSELV